MKHKIRLLEATINNVKNVKTGVLPIENINSSIEGEYGNVIGIYGQNGSGKTSFVDACNILKELMLGNKLKIRNKNNELISDKYEKYISIDEESMVLDYKFYVSTTKDYFVNYIVEITKDSDSFHISKETVKCKPLDKSKDLHKMISIKAIEDDFDITPKARVKNLMKYDKNAKIDIEVAYEFTKTEAQSTIFNDKVINLFAKAPENTLEYQYNSILKALKTYAMWKLLIVDKNDIGLISLGTYLPLRVYCNRDGNIKLPVEAIGTIGLSISGNSQIPEKIYKLVTNVFKQISIILTTLVPGLSVRLEKVSTIQVPGEDDQVKVKLLSVRNGKTIDFEFESGGIIKIVSILNYMSAMFNSDSVCLVVDEFDSGIHEYLMGEILSVLSDRCEGQFIFTSHNLRPLEKLSKDHILFTTTNEHKKYIKFKDIKPVQNLRDCYYRAIQLGGQDEELYETTKAYNIKKAFRHSVEEVSDDQD